jgi:hypothetical protein
VLSVAVGASGTVVGGEGGAHAASPARSAIWAAARGGITAPLDVQNAAADVWSCTVRTRRESASSASPSCVEKKKEEKFVQFGLVWF